MASARLVSPALVRVDLDLVERVVAATLYAFMVARFAPNVLVGANVLGLLLLFSESMVVLFVIFRRRTEMISRQPLDWLAAFIGTAGGLLVIQPEGEPIAPVMVCALLMCFGCFLHIAAKLTLRRSFGLVAANRGVKAGGPYRYLRHPMYAGYILTEIGFLLGGPTVWNCAVYGICFGFQLWRLLAEERVLKQDPAYQALCKAVPYRLMPLVY